MLTLAVSGTSIAAPEEEPICADRPGKSSEPCTVPAGHFQVETGLADWTLQKSAHERDTSLAIGETEFKYGLTDTSDIEVDVTPWLRVASHDGSVHHRSSGFGDVEILYKHRLTAAEAPLQATLYPFVKVPTAKRPVGNGEWEGGLLVPLEYDIPNSRLTIETTPEIDWVGDEDGRGHHIAMDQVASVGWQVTYRLSLSAELWGEWDWDPAGTTRQASADGSVAYLVNKDLQLDGGANFGLNRQTPDIELYAGVSKRF